MGEKPNNVQSILAGSYCIRLDLLFLMSDVSYYHFIYHCIAMSVFRKDRNKTSADPVLCHLVF